MHESRIPSINSGKRQRPFSSASLPDEDRLPEIHVTKKRHSALANITNVVMSSGVTSMASKSSMKAEPFSSPYQSQRQSTNMRLLNKYFYGDPTVIEEVKKRERKVLKDIHISSNQIKEVDAELENLNNNIIPQLKYDLNKKSNIFRHMKQDTLSMQEQLYQLNNDCDLKKKNHELMLNNLSLNHSVNMQDMMNYWHQKISEKRHDWELKIQKLKQTEPDPAVLNDIKMLKAEKQEREKTLQELKNANESELQDHENKLKIEFEQFKQEKKKPLAKSISENKKLNSELNELIEKKKSLLRKIDDKINEENSLREAIKERNLALKALDDSIEPIEHELNHLQLKFRSEKEITDAIKSQAKLAETEYTKQYDRMEQEQLQRRILENTIDDLDGHIRCFAYINCNDHDEYEVDYMNKCIIGDHDTFYFNRVLPRDLVSPLALFSSECFTFIDSSLKGGKSCNIISINDDLRKQFLETIQQKYPNLKILVQMVVLNDDDSSKDLLNLEDSDLSAVIEEKCIDFHARRLPITEVDGYMVSDFNGIHVTKFEIFRDEHNFESIFFIQAPKQEVDKLNVIRTSKLKGTPVSTFLQSLLSRLQSLIVFNFDTLDLSLLQLSQTLHKLPNPK